MADYVTPTIVDGIFAYFDTGGRYWTPEWDSINEMGRTVKQVLLADGTWHTFDKFVSEAEATLFRITGSTTGEKTP